MHLCRTSLALFLSFALSGLMAPPPAAAATTTGDAANVPSALAHAIERSLYRIEPHRSEPGAYEAHNERHRLAATFRPDGVVVSVKDEPVWEMRLATYGRPGNVVGVADAILDATGNRIEYRRGALVEWYVNDPRGLEQGFTLHERPEGADALLVDLAVTGPLEGRKNGSDLTFESQVAKLGYSKLFAVDATGAVLPSSMELVARVGQEPVIRLTVDDENAVYPVVIDPTITNDKKITASDGAPNAKFGLAVSISGDTAVVGARFQAAAYFFRRNEGGADNWGEVRKITGGVWFGFSLALDGDTAVVSAPVVVPGTNGCQRGRADVYERNHGGAENWGLVANLEPLITAGGSNCVFYGWSVDIDGDTAVVGAPGTFWWGSTSSTPDANDPEGSVHVFERDEGGTDAWGVVKKLIAADQSAGDSFGFAVAVDGDTIVVGAPTEEDALDASGSAYIYPRDPVSGDWLSGQQVKVAASDAAILDLFGSAVAVDGDTILIGAPNDDGVETDAGSVYVLGRDVGGANAWGEVAKLTAAAQEEFEEFGVAVALDGDHALVGARFDAGPNLDIGSAWLFGRNSGGTDAWGELVELVSEDGPTTDLFGRGVSIDGTTLIVGAPGGEAAYIFDLPCGNGVIDTGETCDDGNTEDGDCCSSTCQIETAGTVCRGSADVCDVAETCDGVSGSCPADGFATDTTECRAAAGVCDVADFCTGLDAACPADAKSTGECRASAGACDLAESCDGISDSCPADELAPAATECRGSAGVCDVAETCTGVDAACPADLKSTAECRGSAGSCDVAEACDGSSDSCPADGFVTAGTECRASAGACDAAEACDGGSAACPADAKETAGTECRGSAGSCDVAEVCDGSSDGCPADGFESAGTECRAAGGVCDVAETCDGGSASCPADAKATAGTECRGLAGACDVAEVCDGSSDGCPADGFESAATECRAASGVCDEAESCDGASAACPADGFVTAGTECRAASGICDVAESCDGASADCPVDGFEAAGTECPDGDLCNGTETCDGSGTCQSASGPSCDDANPCTLDSCDPILGCSNDAAPATTCADTWEKGQLLVNEKAVGKEKVIVKLIKGPALTQADFGDPVLGSTAYDLCVYDDAGQLAAHMQVDRAGLDCAGKDCWKALGTKGLLYKDKDLSSDGVQLIKLLGGDEGKSKILVKAKNNAKKGQLDMPVGISAALAGSTSATVQLHGSAPEGCYSATLVDVITNDANLFKAK